MWYLCRQRIRKPRSGPHRPSPDRGGRSDEQPVFPLTNEGLLLSAAENDEDAEKAAGRCSQTDSHLWWWPRLKETGPLKVTATSGVLLYPGTDRPRPLFPNPGQLWKAIPAPDLSVESGESFTGTSSQLSFSFCPIPFPFCLFYTRALPGAVFNKRLANSSSSQSMLRREAKSRSLVPGVFKGADANAGFQGWLVCGLAGGCSRLLESLPRRHPSCSSWARCDCLC